MTGRHLLGAVLLAAATAAAWWLWLGHDTTYYKDPDTGVRQGPYRAWQVVGLVVSLIALGVVALMRRLQPLLAAGTLTIALTAAVAATWMPSDPTGLSIIGVLMVFVGFRPLGAVRRGNFRPLGAVRRATSARSAPYGGQLPPARRAVRLSRGRWRGGRRRSRDGPARG